MSPLERLQLDAQGRLDSLPGFTRVPVTVMRPRSEAEALAIKTEIDQALAGLITKGGKSGVAVIIAMPEVLAPEGEAPGPDVLLGLMLRVIEEPLVNMGVNGTHRSAEDVGLAVLQGLHRFLPGGGLGMLYPAEQAMRPNESFTGKVAYDVHLRCTLDLVQPPQAPAPTLSLQLGHVVLAGPPNPAAEVRYTLDGSFPGPGATLYTAPFDAAAGTIRAATYLPGMTGSNLLTVELTPA